MFGVFGMPAVGVVFFCLRAIRSNRAWNKAEGFVRVGSWGLNIGLGLVIALDLFPAASSSSGTCSRAAVGTPAAWAT